MRKEKWVQFIIINISWPTTGKKDDGEINWSLPERYEYRQQ